MNIFEAIKENNIDKVKELLDLGVDVNSYNESMNIPLGYSPLHIAIIYNNFEITKLLLAHPDIDINIKISDDYEDFPLILAVESDENNAEIVKLLLDNPDIDVNSKNRSGHNALLSACMFPRYTVNNEEMEKIEIIELLLNHPKIDVNIEDDRDVTPLSYSCNHSKIEIVKLLLKHPNIDVNSHNLLSDMCKGNYIEIAKLLLAHPSIDVNGKYEKNTPLNSAIFSAAEESVLLTQLLVSHPKIDINRGNTFHTLVITVSSKSYDSLYYEMFLKKIDIMTKHPDLKCNISFLLFYSKNNINLTYLLKKRFPRNIELNSILDSIEN